MEINLTLLGAVVLGLVIGYFVRQAIAVRRADSLEQKAKTRIEDAKTDAREIILEAKNQSAKFFEEIKKEEAERNIKLNQYDQRLIKKEENLENQARELNAKKETFEVELAGIDKEKSEAKKIRMEAADQLKNIAGMSVDQAKNYLLDIIKKDYSQDLALAIKKLEGEKQEEIEKKSLDIITTALQRYARSHIADLTTSVFDLPDEELKGKIIGRDGRNIKALERLTGVEIIVDETPEAIVISSFDPMRREIAKLALGKLIKDGRIQPAKIEEKVEEARQDVEKRTMELGEAACYELGIVDFPKEIVQVIGQLHFRTSYGQNVLLHSIEMAHIAGLISAELGLNVEVAKKAALVHDIGKAISHEAEGTHIELGRKLLKKYGVDELVIRAMESHHDDYPYSVPEAFVVTAADVLSGARPGARRDTVENYIKRLDNLEKIAADFDGVRLAYAISGGREIRVFVIPEKIDDFGALQLAKDIASKIQTELKFPGEIKVNVIREMRAVEFAR